MTVVYDLRESLDLLISGELPENEMLNHLDVWVLNINNRSYRCEVFTPGKHLYGDQELEAYEDTGRFFINKPDFDWAGDEAAMIAEFEVRVFGHAEPLRRCVKAGNQHILNTQKGQELIYDMLREPTKREIQKRKNAFRDAILCAKARAFHEITGAPATTTTRKVSAIELAIQSEKEIDPGLKINSPDTFERHLLRKRKVE